MSEDNQKSSMSLEELQLVVNTAVKAALDHSNVSNRAIADALLKAREPYTDPRQKLNDENMRKNMRESVENQKRQVIFDQANCVHKKGANPLSARIDFQDSSFAKHRLDTGEVIGICTNCTKVISSLNQEDMKHFQDRGSNIMSSAGIRNFNDPLKVQKKRLGLDQKEIFIEEEEPVAQ